MMESLAAFRLLATDTPCQQTVEEEEEKTKQMPSV
jgi:hypothetical protein